MTISIVSVALTQLRTAIQLLEERNYIPALTTAAAAEEILGKIAYKTSGYNAITASTVFLNQLAEYLGKPPIEQKKVADLRNKAKNAVKHNDLGRDINIHFDFKMAAEELILDAISNYIAIYDRIPGDRVIRRYWDWVSL